MITFRSFLALFFSCLHCFSQQSDSVSHQQSVKIDFTPLYHVFFDARYQIRAGTEYERHLSEKIAFGIYVDVGIYDKYTFTKYYDFFNQYQGMYFVRQKVYIAGFHLLPSCNYYFFRFRKKPNRKFFSGVVLDFGYYHKNFEIYNSSTLEESSDSYHQTRLGAGLSVGFSNKFSDRILYELKTSLFTKVFNLISKDGYAPTKSLDAQWTSSGYNLWWISNIKVGYVF